MFKDARSTPLAAVTVNCLLSKNEDLTTVGAALASNIARFKVTRTFSTVYVVVNFLFQLIFIFPLFWGMVMYANEFKRKEKQKLTEIKN